MDETAYVTFTEVLEASELVHVANEAQVHDGMAMLVV